MMAPAITRAKARRSKGLFTGLKHYAVTRAECVNDVDKYKAFLPFMKDNTHENRKKAVFL
jgi:hypothetical protein